MSEDRAKRWLAVAEEWRKAAAAANAAAEAAESASKTASSGDPDVIAVNKGIEAEDIAHGAGILTVATDWIVNEGMDEEKALVEADVLVDDRR